MDFYDKLVISITMVIVTIFCLFNSFCFADTSLSGVQKNDLVQQNLGVGNNKLVFSESRFGCYFSLKAGHRYKITNKFDTFVHYCFTDLVPDDGVSVLDGGQNLNSGSSHTFNANRDTYLFIFIYAPVSEELSIDDISIIDLSPPGFSTAVTDLVYNVGVENIWNTFGISLPYVLVVVGVGFGFYMIFHSIKEISKGREKMN